MAFKNLGDKKRAAALPGFIDAAEKIQGLLLVVLVDKRIKSLFQQTGDDKRVNGDGDILSNWLPKVEGKLLRICHVAALLVAGLSRPGQNIVWISDQDEIAANDQRLRQLTEASGRIMSAYLEHALGHLRVGTTASDSGTRDVEDFVAIADLAAGALCEVLNAHRRAGVDFPLGIFVPNQKGMASKIDPLTWWLSSKRSQLKKIALSLEPIANSSKVNVRHYDFSAHGLPDCGKSL
ncbi:hypothetical protein AVHY2522_20440 [Acidovorax sp. SUPP2522]|uniref:hypothetical protein n=1 Tax=unclassified Acidovorax TaxID=2684926 RepID=UPI00234A855E|nr:MULTISPECIES: hypothetical protein [unclassified Acidovorax]WCM99502.1 hypothetical protein M5C96_08875 [Acidovorax sp. GBBC 1281]GKT18873.1 hypothetical protein AVHY2522_20440 [Acidovorax sp. SUPP2522]